MNFLQRSAFLSAAFLLTAGGIDRAEAGLILGSTIHGTATVDWTPTAIFDANAAVAEPGVEFAGFVNPAFFGTSVQAYGDVAETTIRVGFKFLALPGFGAASERVYTFTFTNLQLAPGEEIVGLSVLENDRNVGSQSFSTTSNSITIVLTGFSLGSITPTADDDDAITYTILTRSAVPEPSGFASGLIGLSLAAGALRRRRRAQA